MKIAVLIATRLGSKRIRNKSTKKFGKFNLTTLKIIQAKRAGVFSNFYFSSNSKTLNKFAEQNNFKLITRPNNMLGNATISDFGPYLAKKISENHICYLTNTSPLISNKTLKKAIKIYKKMNKKKFNSLNTFEVCNYFLWDDKKSINYKITNQPPSQELKNFYFFNPSIAIISKKNIIKYKNVCGTKPYKLIINKPESIDIDTIYDYELALLFNKK